MGVALYADANDSECLLARPMNETSPASWHQPVMVEEVLRLLNLHAGAAIVDATGGTGGHSSAIAPRVLPGGRLIIIDRDRESLGRAHRRLAEFETVVQAAHGNFRHLPAILQHLGVARVDGLLLDLGMSSVHVDEGSRGFSFLKEGPLDMRMDLEQALTAQTLVNTLSKDELAQLFERLGEERFARRIADRIVQERRRHAMTTTTQLAQLIVDAVPPGARRGRLHPATRTFQALRIAVNDELGALEEGLGCLEQVLNPGGRVVILTFHSLEDRMVKRSFAQREREAGWTLLSKKPLRPSVAEISRNPRARSAKLRAIARPASSHAGEEAIWG